MKTIVPEMKLSTFAFWIMTVSIGFMFALALVFNTYIIVPLQIDNGHLRESAVYQSYAIDSLKQVNIVFNDRISELEKPTSFAVRMTNYYPVEAQCDADPLITASGMKIIKDEATDHRWIAISWDLHTNLSYRLPKDDPAYGKGTFEMGDYVRLTGYGQSVDGIYQIQDTMNSRHRMAIDRLTNIDSPLEFAEAVTITKVFIPELHAIDA